MDHKSFFLGCGFEENQHTGHPPLLSNKIRNCKHFLTVLPWKMLLQWVLPTSSPPKLICSPKPVPVRSLLVVRWHICKEWHKSWWLPSLLLLMLLQHHLSLCPPTICWIVYKTGASYVCLYHNGKTKELCGNSAKAAWTEDNPHDVSHELTCQQSVIPDDDTSPFLVLVFVVADLFSAFSCLCFWIYFWTVALVFFILCFSMLPWPTMQALSFSSFPDAVCFARTSLTGMKSSSLRGVLPSLKVLWSIKFLISILIACNQALRTSSSKF